MTLLFSAADVRRLLPMREAIEAMDGAFRALSNAETRLPLRSIVWTPDKRGGLGLMPGYLPAGLGAKIVTVFPGNHGTELDSHQGVVLLFEPERGRLIAVVDATAITAIRTAAVSALATRLLAREDAGDLAVFGSGTQARSHVEAMLAVRKIRRIRVWSRTAENARAFAEREGRRHGVGIDVCASPEEAARAADLLCTTTGSREPFLRAEWLAPGAHVNAAGSSVRTDRELDGAVVARSALFVDRRESTVNEAGDFILAKAEGAVTDDHIRGEIGDVLTGKIPGRRSADEITLFKSLGLAIEDIASADHVLRRAEAEGAGVRFAFGGEREA
ncbi:MAG TPA: ornithine cyclodeaminase family protein [Thermoanaerobaculia bacterium]|nr:ornithine cyclodeaminase family protein [Thermoanaerobaculia bacterium]